jgi:large subunit ribosomal protein L9
MKVILLKDIPNLGSEGDVKEAASGYARNFLFPKGLAEVATDEKIKAVEEKKAKKAKDSELDLANTEKLVQKLEGQTVEIKAKASDEGTLYAAVSSAKMAKVLQDKGFDIKKEQIKAEHIKELGEHEVTIELNHGLEARITLIINSE